MQIEFPLSDFGQPFEKDYEMHGAQFTIRVLNVGPTDLGPTWLFELLVKGRQIEGGPYHPKHDRELTDENVANHLASFWGHSKMVADAWELAGSPEWELDRLAFKCADWMHKYFMQESSFKDFEIIQKFMDGNGWEITLSPNYQPDYILEFSQQTGDETVRIISYVKDREINTVL